MLTWPIKVGVAVVSSLSLVMMGNGSLLNEMKQHLLLHICCNAPQSNTHYYVDDDVRAGLVAVRHSQMRSQYPIVIPCSASTAVTSNRVVFVSVIESSVWYRLLTECWTLMPVRCVQLSDRM